MTTDENVTDAHFGMRMQQARKARHWTQKQLAEALDTDPSSISRMESGKQQIPLIVAVKAAHILGVNLVDLTRPLSQVGEVLSFLRTVHDTAVIARSSMANMMTAAKDAREALADAPDKVRHGISGNVDVSEFVSKRVVDAALGAGVTASNPDPAVAQWMVSLIPAVAQGIAPVRPADPVEDDSAQR